MLFPTWCAIFALYFLARKITRCISHISPDSVSSQQLVFFFRQSPFWTNRQKCQTGLMVAIFGDSSKMEIVEKKGTSCLRLDSVRLVDVRYSVLYFLAARKITRCTSHIYLQFVLKQPSATSPLFFRQSLFWTNRQKCQQPFQVNTFGDLSKMEIVEKKGGLVADGCVKGRRTRPC